MSLESGLEEVAEFLFDSAMRAEDNPMGEIRLDQSRCPRTVERSLVARAAIALPLATSGSWPILPASEQTLAASATCCRVCTGSG